MWQKVITKWNNIWEEYHKLTILFCHEQIPNTLTIFLTVTFSEFSTNNKQAEHLDQIFSSQADLEHNNWGWWIGEQRLIASEQCKCRKVA